jgi:hypothetical protein
MGPQPFNYDQVYLIRQGEFEYQKDFLLKFMHERFAHKYREHFRNAYEERFVGYIKQLETSLREAGGKIHQYGIKNEKLVDQNLHLQHEVHKLRQERELLMRRYFEGENNGGFGPSDMGGLERSRSPYMAAPETRTASNSPSTVNFYNRGSEYMTRANQRVGQKGNEMQGETINDRRQDHQLVAQVSWRGDNGSPHFAPADVAPSAATILRNENSPSAGGLDSINKDSAETQRKTVPSNNIAAEDQMSIDNSLNRTTEHAVVEPELCSGTSKKHCREPEPETAANRRVKARRTFFVSQLSSLLPASAILNFLLQSQHLPLTPELD